jgi:hypothetical protein
MWRGKSKKKMGSSVRTFWPDKTEEQVWKGTNVRVAKKKDSKLSTHVGMYELTSQTKLRSKCGKNNKLGN